MAESEDETRLRKLSLGVLEQEKQGQVGAFRHGDCGLERRAT